MIVNDSKSIVSNSMNFFVQWLRNLIRKYLNLKDLTLTISKTNLNSLLLNPVNESEIINMFSVKKAVGPHSIPTNILKEYKKILSIPLALIMSISFKRGIFSELCKKGHVILVYKKEDQLDCSNYRPISLLSNISKVFKKPRYSRLYDLLNKYNCFYNWVSKFSFNKSYLNNYH